MSNYLREGYLTKDDIKDFVPQELLLDKTVAVVECIQEIPCNPCVTSCPVGAISMTNINSIPVINHEACTGCGKCVAICPGLAIFLVRITKSGGEVTLPYEMLPLPSKGDTVKLLDRKGCPVGEGKVARVLLPEKSTNSALITISFDNPELVYEVRNIEVKHE